jgi:hypothetical protein
MPQQANVVLRHDLPKSRLSDYDISAGFFSLSMRFSVACHEQFFHRRGRPHPSSPTAFQSLRDIPAVVCRPDFAGS